MTDYIRKLKEYYVIARSHRALRQNPYPVETLAAQWQAEGQTDIQRAVLRLKWMLQQEIPVVFPEDKIGMMRTVPTVPEMHTPAEFAAIKETHYIHEQGKICNICPNYAELIAMGFAGKRVQLAAAKQKWADDPQKTEFLTACEEILDCISAFAARYRLAAEQAGNKTLAECFAVIPEQPPRSFQQALQFFRLLHFCLWCCFNYHNTVGHFDQFMMPYLQADLDAGVLTEDSALELLEEFFISFCKDYDLYPGMQRGDNGQSIVLGGRNPDGTDSFNLLSKLCLQASLELKQIDPKINLRVSRDTPLWVYELGTELTRQGIGFPQYSNDDVVIPALTHWGYTKEDAYRYVVAACWEFIVPGSGMDIPNIGGLSFPKAVQQAVEDLPQTPTFEALLQNVRQQIFAQAEELCELGKNVYMEPSPLLSMMMDGCVENGQDISLGGKYNNYGLHGTGLSTATDALAAIEQYVFTEKTVTAAHLLEALHSNFSSDPVLRNRLRYSERKLGNHIPQVDAIATRLLDDFADALEGKINDRGGIWRAGTGSAMYYVWQSAAMPATADGRDAGEEFACNYSPSLFARCDGPFSIIQSFTAPHLQRVCNGGPLTLELHDTLFRNEESTKKVAQMVKTFMDLGGHQLQLNAVNLETLQDAKAHPEKHRNLIVRVWGWSGYFVELDECYQNHVMKRMELQV